MQGLGYALCEDMGIEDGWVTVSSLGDYKIYCVQDVPSIVSSFVTSTVGPGPFSAKAVGEAGISIVAPSMCRFGSLFVCKKGSAYFRKSPVGRGFFFSARSAITQALVTSCLTLYPLQNQKRPRGTKSNELESKESRFWLMAGEHSTSCFSRPRCPRSLR